MYLKPHRILSLFSIGILSGLGLATMQGCDGDDIKNAACADYGCNQTLLKGNASISGIASVDAFFSSVLSVRDASAAVSGSVEAELRGMAVSLGIEGAADLEISDLAAQVKIAIQAKLEANVKGELRIAFQPPKCEADIDVAVKATAECDVEVNPGQVSVQCEGSCEVSAEVAAECHAEANLTCEGQAPNFQCEGSCKGSCQLEVAAECSGSCSGECDGECSVCAGGECETENGVVTNCAGSCSGMCKGTCELAAGGSCEGRCEGSCEYTPPEAKCEGGAQAKCDFSGKAEAKCEGKCEGSVTPPSAKAECEASVNAKAKAEIQCTPPSLNVEFQFAAGLNADAQAEFKVWLEGFKVRYAALLAAGKKLEFVGQAAVDLSAAAQGAVKASIDAGVSAAADGDVQIITGLNCALQELRNVGTILNTANAQVQASTSAILEVSGSVGGNEI